MPSSATPVSLVVHVSPADTGSARVSVPRRDDLAGCEWRIDLIAHKNIDEMTQRRNGLIQHIRSATVIDDRAGAFPQLRQEGHANARLPSIPKASASSFSSRAS